MSSTWGNSIKISIFGESHSESIGVTIDGLPPGEKIDLEEINFQMQRRAPGNDNTATPRKEADTPNIICGFLNGYTTGTPLCAIIANTNIKSKDYDELQRLIRPGHADFTGNIRYKGFNDIRGGGHFSGRLTAPLTFAGAVCRQILDRKGIRIYSHIYSIYDIYDIPFYDININSGLFKKLYYQRFPLIDSTKEEAMRNIIEDSRAAGDSVGGIVECAIIGLKAGVGSPMFDGIENEISSIIFGIPGVKGIEFGAGFGATLLKGSENNDNFIIKDNKIYTSSNNHGGILGGISSGMPIIFRTALKPTPSISKEQQTVDIKNNTEAKLVVKGRHDPCIVPRAVPVIESAAAIAILNLIMEVN